MAALAIVLRAHVARSRRAVRPLATVAKGAYRGRAVGDERASVGRTDDGQRRRLGMGAALGAAGNVNVKRRAELRARRSRRCRRQRAGGDVRGRTDRRPGAGEDVAARIAGADNEAETFGGGDDRDAAASCARPMIRSARPGAARRPTAPAALAASINCSSAAASAWPKASPTPQASDPSRNGYVPIGSAGLCALRGDGGVGYQQDRRWPRETRRRRPRRAHRGRARHGRAGRSLRGSATAASTRMVRRDRAKLSGACRRRRRGRREARRAIRSFRRGAAHRRRFRRGRVLRRRR